jgi:uncharacterized protein YjiS (DUF1127 family)
MTTISSTAAQPASPAAWGGFVRLLGSSLQTWANNLATYWVRREAIKTLEQLDERALRDIGLPRCHIEAAVNGVTNPDLARMQ